jgi:hypothetical protein
VLLQTAEIALGREVESLETESGEDEETEEKAEKESAGHADDTKPET